MQIIININNATDVPSVLIDDAVSLAVESEAVPRIVPSFTGRMTDDDRRMLWAAWHEAFDDDTSDVERHEFTRVVLGLPRGADTSWSRYGSLTSDQVYHMVRVLKLLADIG